ncbi:MAG TPA: hypothetical protein VGG27_18850 [Magnetospirillaceae bacterium]|jgi:hypothetical protein
MSEGFNIETPLDPTPQELLRIFQSVKARKPAHRAQLALDHKFSYKLRLEMRAYARVIDLEWTDHNDEERPFNLLERASLPWRRLRIRVRHKLPSPIWKWIKRRKWTLAKLAVLLTLFLLAFGLNSPVIISLFVALALGNATAFVIEHYQVVSGILFSLGTLGWIFERMWAAGWLDEVPSSANQEIIPPNQLRAYQRKTGQVYGDARPADDWEVDERLRVRNGGFQQMFEE